MREAISLPTLTSELGPECVWMRAGVLRYKLCDRHFDCEHCPLDAALHGGHHEDAIEAQAFNRRTHHRRRSPVSGFPDDRLYTSSHTWMKPSTTAPSEVRFGIDSFAASILPDPIGVSWSVTPGTISPGTQVFRIEFEFGVISVSLPIKAGLVRRNELLETDPHALTDQPYEAGWIADFSMVKHSDDGLLQRDEAEKQSRLDARQLRRRLAIQLLLPSESSLDRSGVDGYLSTDIRDVLGVRLYLHMLQSFIH